MERKQFIINMIILLHMEFSWQHGTSVFILPPPIGINTWFYILFISVWTYLLFAVQNHIYTVVVMISKHIDWNANRTLQYLASQPSRICWSYEILNSSANIRKPYWQATIWFRNLKGQPCSYWLQTCPNRIYTQYILCFRVMISVYIVLCSIALIVPDYGV